MALDSLEFTKDWTDPEDFPTYEPDEKQVRADLQYLHNEIRDFLNSMVQTLNEQGAVHLGALDGDGDGNTTSIQAALESLRQSVVQSGNVPVGGASGAVLQKKSDTMYDLEWRSVFASVSFTEADWMLVEESVETEETDTTATTEETAETAEASDEVDDGAETEDTEAADEAEKRVWYELVIPATQHKRRDESYGCQLRHRVDGVLKSNTWAVLGTGHTYDSVTGEITLRSADAYDGEALFFSA
jgi:hypothetical protein